MSRTDALTTPAEYAAVGSKEVNHPFLFWSVCALGAVTIAKLINLGPF